MKKILLLMCAIFVMCGCSNNSESTQETKSSVAEEVVAESEASEVKVVTERPDDSGINAFAYAYLDETGGVSLTLVYLEETDSGFAGEFILCFHEASKTGEMKTEEKYGTFTEGADETGMFQNEEGSYGKYIIDGETLTMKIGDTVANLTLQEK